MERIEEIIGIAKRENNTKRNYLVVNKCQGKHVPVSPERPLKMFSELAEEVSKRYQKEQLLLIGFAETATAIGETLAIHLGTDYMQTTREKIEDVEYFYFSESHSHATEQKVIKNDLDAVIGRIDRIIFVEDEVTTGNTIGKIVHLIRQTYQKKLLFSVASLLNGMDEEARERYQKEQIDMIYLIKTDHSRYPEIAEKCSNDGRYHSKFQSYPVCGSVEFADINPQKSIPEIKEISASGFINARRLHQGTDYQAACEKLWQEIDARIPFGTDKNILILGTEEFMYPALYTAWRVEGLGNRVKCHATTRSPIVVSQNPKYPLHERYELISLYEDDRTTYLYDLAHYDLVLILTDAKPGKEWGVASLGRALAAWGNEEIYLVRWCENEKLL
ncbi:hypothetical protein C806_02025 [Lachnospiraceae bacterium 3-1]|nr:hypothetical protein C806_02025 [Lachnospiraceae bacterium 3-1]